MFQAEGDHTTIIFELSPQVDIREQLLNLKLYSGLLVFLRVRLTRR